MRIALDDRQRRFAGYIARFRHARGGCGQYGTRGGLWLDVGAAEAELVVAIGLRLPWSSAFVLGGPDVGSDLEVRWTHRARGRLIVHDDDPNDYLGVLVIGAPSERQHAYLIAGWLEIALAKRRRFIDVPRAGGRAYFVPQSELRPIEELVGA